MKRLSADNLESRLELACVLEATARKAGNVHPSASFCDLCYEDFIDSARIIAPRLAKDREDGFGGAILAAVAAVRREIGVNSNLGIILLLAPLAWAAKQGPLSPEGVESVLSSMTIVDANQVYAAIRLAQPGGLGTANEQDVATGPSVPLREAMSLAADRDLVALQYANGFEQVFGPGTAFLQQWAEQTQDWELAVIGTQLSLMAEWPDTLIARKCGQAVAHESSERARRVLTRGWPDSEPGQSEFTCFDAWLRADGHRRNPGTTADLVAAVLFAGLERKHWPFELPWVVPEWAAVR